MVVIRYKKAEQKSRISASEALTEGSQSPEQRPVVLWGGQDERRHQLAHQLRLDAYALVANYNVHYLRQIGAVHLWG